MTRLEDAARVMYRVVALPGEAAWDDLVETVRIAWRARAQAVLDAYGVRDSEKVLRNIAALGDQVVDDPDGGKSIVVAENRELAAVADLARAALSPNQGDTDG